MCGLVGMIVKGNSGLIKQHEDTFYQLLYADALRGEDSTGVIGVEKDTTFHIAKETLLASFKNLHASIQYHEKSEAFSPRTSTHVHINCRTLDSEEARQLVLFYALFEEFFFAMVDKSRRANIHCVPLTETFLPQIYRYDLTRYIKNWHKYTALNVIPLLKQGSIEFRHLQGTNDAQLLSEWLTTLDNLWQICQREELTTETLADTAKLKQYWKTLFGHSPRVMALEPAFNNVIQNSLIDVKFAFV